MENCWSKKLRCYFTCSADYTYIASTEIIHQWAAKFGCLTFIYSSMFVLIVFVCLQLEGLYEANTFFGPVKILSLNYPNLLYKTKFR
jgi:hypothetical protein